MVVGAEGEEEEAMAAGERGRGWFRGKEEGGKKKPDEARVFFLRRARRAPGPWPASFLLSLRWIWCAYTSDPAL